MSGQRGLSFSSIGTRVELICHFSACAHLAIILLGVAVLVWFAAWLIRFGVPCVRGLRDAAVAHARSRDTGYSRVTLALLDANKPGPHALLLTTALVRAAGWLFLGKTCWLMAR